MLAKSKDINRQNMKKTCENILVKLIEVGVPFLCLLKLLMFLQVSDVEVFYLVGC